MSDDARRRKRSAIILRLCGGAFALRVAAQLVQRWRHVAWLPPFEAWQSGLLPYPVLLSVQLAILVAQARFTLTVTRSQDTTSRRAGRVWLGLGAIYFAAMLGRLVLGATIRHTHWWFDAPLPTTFHLVLATNVITVGTFLLSSTRPGRTGG